MWRWLSMNDVFNGCSPKTTRRDLLSLFFQAKIIIHTHFQATRRHSLSSMLWLLHGVSTLWDPPQRGVQKAYKLDISAVSTMQTNSGSITYWYILVEVKGHNKNLPYTYWFVSLSLPEKLPECVQLCIRFLWCNKYCWLYSDKIFIRAPPTGWLNFHVTAMLLWRHNRLKYTFAGFDERNNNASRTAGLAGTTGTPDCNGLYIWFLIMPGPESNDQNKMLHQG